MEDLLFREFCNGQGFSIGRMIDIKRTHCLETEDKKGLKEAKRLKQWTKDSWGPLVLEPPLYTMNGKRRREELLIITKREMDQLNSYLHERMEYWMVRMSHQDVTEQEYRTILELGYSYQNVFNFTRGSEEAETRLENYKMMAERKI